MRQWILIALAIVFFCFVCWLVWINRSSEKLVATSVSLFVAACIGATLNVLVFSQATKDVVEFPVQFKIKNATGEPYEFLSYGDTQHLYPFAIAALEKSLSKEKLAALDLGNTRSHPNFYLQVLQWSVLRPPRRQRAAKLLHDIAASLEVIPEGSRYWAAVKGGLAEVNLDGWRFEYCVDPEARCIVVVAARRMAESPHKGTVRRTAG